MKIIILLGHYTTGIIDIAYFNILAIAFICHFKPLLLSVFCFFEPPSPLPHTHTIV